MRSLIHILETVWMLLYRGVFLALLGLSFSGCYLFDLMKADCQAMDPVCHPELLLFYQPARVPRFLYVTYSNGTLAGYAIDRNSGSLNQVVSPFGMGNGINYLMVDPSGEYLYATYYNGVNNNIVGYRIGYGGELSTLPGFPMAGPASSVLGDTMTPDGRFQYYGFNNPLGTGSASAIAGYSRDSGGYLTPAGSPFGTGCTPAQMTVDTQGRFLYASSYAPTVGIYGFQINQTSGVTTPFSPAYLSLTYTPTSLSSDPSGNVLLATTGASVYSYSIASSGNLTATASPFSLPVAATSLQRGYSGGNIVYATTTSPDNKIHTLAVNATNGAMSQVAYSPFGLGNMPGKITPDSTGRLVFVAADNGAGGGLINVLAVGSDGSASQLPNSPYRPTSTVTSMGVSVQPE